MQTKENDLKDSKCFIRLILFLLIAKMKFAINAKKEEKKEKEAIPSAPELEENSNLTKKVQSN